MASPLEIEIMLHYHYSAEDFRGGDFSPPAVGNAIRRFEATDMLTRVTDQEARYWITEKGTVYVNALCAVPLPVPEWKIVWPKQ